VIVRPHSILLDAEALSALANHERRMQAWAAIARRTDSTLHVSTVTLTETTDGTSRDALVRRAVKTLRTAEVTADIAYTAGRLRAAAATARRRPRDLTVDAIIVATALTLHPPVVVLTCDPEDLRLLLTDEPIKIETIS